MFYHLATDVVRSTYGTIYVTFTEELNQKKKEEKKAFHSINGRLDDFLSLFFVKIIQYQLVKKQIFLQFFFCLNSIYMNHFFHNCATLIS